MNILRIFTITWIGIITVLILYQPYDPLEINVNSQLKRPSEEHWCGTDRLGRDVLSRTGFGLRRTLIQAGAAEVVGFSLAVMMAFGTTMAGRRWRVPVAGVRMLILAMRTLPPFLVALSLAVFLRGSTIGIIAALCSLSFLFSQPVFEAEIQQAFKHPAVEGAITLGADRLYIARFNLLPLIGPRLVRYATLDFASLVAFAALFSFIGLTNPPYPSLGEMLYEARPYIIDFPWLFATPCITLILVLVGMWLAGVKYIEER